MVNSWPHLTKQFFAPQYRRRGRTTPWGDDLRDWRAGG